jgi:hypothetical protein
VRFVTAQETAHRVLYHEDIDLTKMNNLAKVEEEHIKQILILCRATKAQVTGNFHYTPTSTTRNYYDEEIIDRDGPSFTNLPCMRQNAAQVSNWYHCRPRKFQALL